MIEALLTKIASVIFKKVLAHSGFKALAAAYEIYSVIDTISDLSDCVETTNDCSDLAVFGIEVISNPLTELAYHKLVEIGSHTYYVEKTSSGIYIASNLIPEFKASSNDIPLEVFKGGPGSFRSGSKGSFRSGSRNF
jgi:hypothetical protein